MDGPQTFTFSLPQKENKEYITFLALGCAGSGNQGQKIVSEQMAKIAEEEKAAFVLYLGDNIYGCGVKSASDKQWKKQFEGIYIAKSLDIPFYSILGNHDYIRNERAQLDYSKKSNRWKMPDRYYSFSKKAGREDIDFFAIDTEALIHHKAETDLVWLEKSLSESKAKWKIVFGHHPMRSSEKRYRDQVAKLRELLEALFVKYDVDFYISAHSHNMAAFKSALGVRYVITGAGSRPRDVYWTDEMEFASAKLGFTFFRVSAESIQAHFVNQEGETVYAYEVKK